LAETAIEGDTTMTSNDRTNVAARTLKAFVADFAVALLLFAAVTGVFSIGTSNAFPAPPPAELVRLTADLAAQAAFVPALVVEQPVFAELTAGPTRGQTLLVLAFAFATLAAMNMAVLRHLRTAYASPRRRSWGRG
jgi:hypothetical protein